MKKFLSSICVALIIMKSAFTFSYAADVESMEYAQTNLINFCTFTVHYGEYYGVIYDYDLKESYIKTQVSDLDNESDSSLLIDFNFKKNSIDISKYKFMKIRYYRTADSSAIRLKTFLSDGNNTQFMKYGKSGEWHELVFDFGDVKSGTMLKQLHFTPYPDMSAQHLTKTNETLPEVYIKMIGFYTADPRTEEQLAEDAKLQMQADAIKGEIQENGIFKDIEKFKKTDELLTNTSIETLSNWSGTYANVELSDNAYDGGKCAKISNRTVYYSGIKQDITSVFKKYGAGYYKISAYLRVDENSPNIGNTYDVRIGLTRPVTDSSGTVTKKTTFYYSSYPVLDKWQKNENVVYVPWDDEFTAASFAVYGGTKEDDLSDFYVDKCSLIKYIQEEENEIHNAYISGDLSGKFYPDKNITGFDFVNALENCKNIEINDAIALKETVSGFEAMQLVKNLFNYDGSVDYSSKTAITRAEAVHLINSVSNKKAEKTSYTYVTHPEFTDVDESHWAYEDIIEATTSHNAFIYKDGSGEFSEAWDINEKNYDKTKAIREINKIYCDSEERKNKILSSTDNLNIKGTTYYISNVGSDDNSGLTPEKPIKTISKMMSLNLNPGDAVLFNRGNLWRDVSFSAKEGVTYGAYGCGDKPKLYGSAKNYAYPELWVETGIENVWTTTDNIIGSVGFVSFNDGESFALKVNSEDLLDKNNTFYDGSTADGKIKLYSSNGNPGDVYNSIEIAPGKSIIKIMNTNDCTIDNLCLMYAGWHGIRIANSNNTTVTNCVIGNIGGTGESTRWGNGVEFWNKCDGGVIKDNYLFQIYDTALTNQYSGVTASPSVQSNILYTGNLIDYCTYAFEFFAKQENSNLDLMKNITVTNNITRYTGFGWGEDNRPIKETSADLKGWRAKNRAENFVISNNIFYKTRFKFIDWSSFAYNLNFNKLILYNKTPQYLPKLQNNTFVTDFGTSFGEFDYKSYTMDYSVNKMFAQNRINENSKILFISPDEFEMVEYMIERPVINVENNTIAAGNHITAKIKLSDNYSSEDKKINFALCLYSGIKLKTMNITTYTHAGGEYGKELTCRIKIPNGTYKNYEIRAFVMDDCFNEYIPTTIIKY